MYLNEIITDKINMLHPSFQVEFTKAEVEQADRVEVWSSEFNDPGPDCNQFLLIGGDKKVIRAVEQPGF